MLQTGVSCVILGLVIPTAVVRAQEQSGNQANPPAPPVQASNSSETTANSAQALNANAQGIMPDTLSLSGAQGLSLAVPAGARSFWQPLFNVTSTFDTNPPSANATAGTTTWTSLYGGLRLRQVSRRSDLTLNYLGGGLTSNDGTTSTSLIQQLEFGEKRSWRRTTVSFFDLLSYLPEASFGFSLPTALALPSGQGISLEPVLIPNQTVLTTRGQRTSNTSLAELDTALTARTSLTFVGAYALLHFSDNGFLNLSDTIFQAGLNRQIGRNDTIALLYRLNAYRYDNFDQSIVGHVVQVSYGRRIAGRLAFQVAAGPEVAFLRTPVPPATTSLGVATTSSSTRAYWTLDTSLTYQIQRTAFELAYDHSLSGGAGVLAGAINDQVSGSVSNQFSSAFKGGLVLGYARNGALSTPAPTPSNQVYNYWFAGMSLSHRLNRSMDISFNYQAQIQDSNAEFCVGVNCGRSFARHAVSVGFNWLSRPVPIG